MKRLAKLHPLLVSPTMRQFVSSVLVIRCHNFTSHFKCQLCGYSCAIYNWQKYYQNCIQYFFFTGVGSIRSN